MDKTILKSKKKLLQYLGINENFLYGDFSRRYSELKLPKPDGSFRTIQPPHSKVKILQRKILDSIIFHTKLNDSVFGLEASKSILENARMHQVNWNQCLVVLDVTNFFPSITITQVKQVFGKMGFNSECTNVLTKLCTVDKAVPQGAPTSPYLSALVFHDIDKNIYAYCKKNHLTYTRYFDDISVSGKTMTERQIKYIENLILRGKFELNESKKKFYKPTERKTINNIVIYRKSFDVTEEYKKKICDSFSQYSGSRSKKNWNVFMGNFAFFIHVNRIKALNLMNYPDASIRGIGV